jgi:3-dehydroquinate dehydratase-2
MATHKLLLINGPNLNLLGTREPHRYGKETLADVESNCLNTAAELGAELTCFQSNSEGEIVEAIQQAKHDQIGMIIINAGAYTHTSIAIRDALLGVAVPLIEIHVSNIYQRETFRHHSYLSDIAVGIIAGLGTLGYEHAIRSAVATLEKQ